MSGEKSPIVFNNLNFLIDKHGSPLFVGNPTANEKQNEILDDILLTI